MPELYDVQEVLDPRTLTEMYSENGEQFTQNPLVDFYEAQIKEISGSEFEFAKDAAEKEPAPANKHGAAARVLQARGADNKKVTMLRAFNEVGLGMDALHMFRNPNDEFAR
jgi:hypothetical protein